MIRMKTTLRVQYMIKTQRVKSRVISLFGENIMTGLITGNVSSKTGKIKSAYAMSRAGRILIIGYMKENTVMRGLRIALGIGIQVRKSIIENKIDDNI